LLVFVYQRSTVTNFDSYSGFESCYFWSIFPNLLRTCYLFNQPLTWPQSFCTGRWWDRDGRSALSNVAGVEEDRGCSRLCAKIRRMIYLMLVYDYILSASSENYALSKYVVIFGYRTSRSSSPAFRVLLHHTQDYFWMSSTKLASIVFQGIIVTC
jgi:hypothetical protein